MAYIVAGFLTGIIGGLFGVGGGEIFIPLLVYAFGFSQHAAQGTSLAVLLPPIGLLAALRYYRAGHVDFGVAGLLAVGFFFVAPGFAVQNLAPNGEFDTDVIPWVAATNAAAVGWTNVDHDGCDSAISGAAQAMNFATSSDQGRGISACITGRW